MRLLKNQLQSQARKSRELTPQERMKIKIKEFISREVYKPVNLRKQLSPTGYEAFRVSPRPTMKYGMLFKKIYGATVAPDYSRPIGKRNKFGNPIKFGAMVKWYPHGYTSAKAKSGTFLLQPLKSYPIDIKEAKYKLMIK